MGQKVNPLGIRLGITRDWSSRWFAGKKQFPVHVHTDFRVREFLKEKLKEEAPHFMRTIMDLSLPSPYSRLGLPPLRTRNKDRAEEINSNALDRAAVRPDAGPDIRCGTDSRGIHSQDGAQDRQS